MTAAVTESSPRRRKLPLVHVAVAAVVLLAVLLAFLLELDAPATQELRAGQPWGEVSRLLYGTSYDAVLDGGGNGRCYFFAGGQQWRVTFTAGLVAHVDHSPDQRPFLERARYTLERGYRRIRRWFG